MVPNPGHTVTIGYGFTGLLLEMEDGRIMQHCSTDPIQTFAEITPSNDHYEQLKALMKYED